MLKIHNRRTIRLQGYDYSQEGLYFVTICCDKMKCLFGQIEDGQMTLNEFGEIAYNEWLNLKNRFEYFELDVFQIMPNHMHGIISITQNLVITEIETTKHQTNLGNIVGTYKSMVANKCLEIYKKNNENMGKLWQRNYYEHIIRDEKAYQNISNYIIENPSKWQNDKFFQS